MKTTLIVPTIGRASRGTRGFSLVEVTLAVAVVAIGLMGVLGLFPLGLDAVRQSADATQMMAIGQDNIAFFQQEAANSNFYASSLGATNVIDPSSLVSGSYSNNLSVDGIGYRVEANVLNSGFSTITVGTPPTNMISRVQIGVYRIITNTVAPFYKPIGRTNYYFTEVDRYVQ